MADRLHEHSPWNSHPKEATYVALKEAIIDLLPASIALVGDDAVAHMWHYLCSSGRPFTIDLDGMIDEVPSAREDYEDEVWQAQAFVESLPVGIHSIASSNTEWSYNQKEENKNWYYAIGGYHRWGMGTATVTQSAQGQVYALDFRYKFLRSLQLGWWQEGELVWNRSDRSLHG